MRAAGAAALIVCAIAIIYARSTSAYFFNDDFHWLSQTQGFSPAAMLDLSRYDHFYRPVIETYFFVGLTLFACNPFPFHLASIGVHLLTTLLVYLFARDAAGAPARAFAFLAALVFAVQPGFTDAVTWIGAITDELPVPWYVLTLWLHLRVLRGGGWLTYAAAIGAFAGCHLTHESAATLLPMLVLADCTVVARGPARQRLAAVANRWRLYLPFAALLLLYLAVAYVVNTRSYLVQEGHYAIGWHAIPNIANYIVWLYVGRRAAIDYVLLTAVLSAVMVWGSPRMRFSAAWIVITLLPVSFFTWENAPRYLYLPAVGFAMLAGDLLLSLRAMLARRLSPAPAGAVLVVIIAIVVVRFAVFAKKAADSFPARTAAYARFVEELRRQNPGAVAGGTVVIDQKYLEGVPELYREPAARVGLCLPDLRLQMR